MQWVSFVFSAVAFSTVGELSPLSQLGTVVFFDFSVSIVTVFGSDLQLETWYDVLSLPYLLYLSKTIYPSKWKLLL